MGLTYFEINLLFLPSIKIELLIISKGFQFSLCLTKMNKYEIITRI
jgi:hypothetical protein